jgi:predicted GNAT family acetyltransferase
MPETVRHVPEQLRYLFERDGEVIGLTSYRNIDGAVHITHTEIQPVLRGQGLGGRMVQQVLDELRTTTDAPIVPICPFVDRWIADHREYQDLLSR